MSNELKPMLNTPVETESDAGEEFAQTVIARMDGAHDAHTEVNRMLAEPPEQELERIEKFKKDAISRCSELTGLVLTRMAAARLLGESEWMAISSKSGRRSARSSPHRKTPRKPNSYLGKLARCSVER